MGIELAAVPVAMLAGALGIMSPCVWPLIPIIIGSSAGAGRAAPWALAVGLALAFAVSGTLLSFVLVFLGIDPELFRYLAAGMLIVVAVPLLHSGVGQWLSNALSRLTAGLPMAGSAPSGNGVFGQFGMGALLGLVWLPCVGPTLGAAIALASMGQQMGHAFAVMLAFGLGTAAALLAAALLSSHLLGRWRPTLLRGAGRGKQALGVLLGLLGVAVLTGWDKRIEAWALPLLPEWAIVL
jgi:cytochrome c biogenesis protein CcdA